MEFNHFLFRFSSTILGKISVKSFSSERSQEDGTRDSYSPWFLNNHCCILANDAPTPIHIPLHFLCRCQFRWPFLVARTQLYKPLCWSVCQLVGPSVAASSEHTTYGNRPWYQKTHLVFFTSSSFLRAFVGNKWVKGNARNGKLWGKKSNICSIERLVCAVFS